MGAWCLAKGGLRKVRSSKFTVAPLPPEPEDKYKWYSVNVGEAIRALLDAKKNLTEANRLVNGA